MIVRVHTIRIITIITFMPEELLNSENSTPSDNSSNSQPPGTAESTTTQNSQSQSGSGDAGVRNPDKLLELFNKQKDELKELKAFKAQQEKLKADAEAERLKKEQQYEALIPLKIDEAVNPLKQQLESLNAEKDRLAKELAEAIAAKTTIENEKNTEKLKRSVYKSYIKNGGIESEGEDSPFDLLWNSYASKFSLNKDNIDVNATDEKGKPLSLDGFITSLKQKPSLAPLFKAELTNGSGTPPQATQGRSTVSDGVKPRVVTKEQMANPKRHGFTIQDIKDGKVVIAK